MILNFFIVLLYCTVQYYTILQCTPKRVETGLSYSKSLRYKHCAKWIPIICLFIYCNEIFYSFASLTLSTFPNKIHVCFPNVLVSCRPIAIPKEFQNIEASQLILTRNVVQHCLGLQLLSCFFFFLNKAPDSLSCRNQRNC